MNPRWSRVTKGPRRGPHRMRKAFAITLLSTLVIDKGRVLVAAYTWSPDSVTRVGCLGRQHIKDSFKSSWSAQPGRIPRSNNLPTSPKTATPSGPNRRHASYGTPSGPGREFPASRKAWLIS
eukprot:3577608-Pyramimonas_sp.AAC.1